MRCAAALIVFSLVLAAAAAAQPAGRPDEAALRAAGDRFAVTARRLVDLVSRSASAVLKDKAGGASSTAARERQPDRRLAGDLEWQPDRRLQGNASSDNATTSAPTTTAAPATTAAPTAANGTTTAAPATTAAPTTAAPTTKAPETTTANATLGTTAAPNSGPGAPNSGPGGCAGGDDSSQQCSWSDSRCTPNCAFMDTLVPKEGTLRSFMNAQQTCFFQTSEASCKAQADAKCAWETTSGKSECMAVTDDFMQTMMGDLLDGSGCGWMGKVMDVMKCEMYSASDSQCSAANHCRKGSKSVPTGGACSQKESCEAEDPMKALCPGLDMEKKLTQCVEQHAASGGAMPDGEDTSDMTAIMELLGDCIFDGCPDLKEMFAVMMDIMGTCAPLSAEETCEAQAKCSWGGSECEPNAQAMMHTAVPDGCAFKPVLALMGQCEGKTKDTCSGACEWQQELDCEGGSPQEKASCGPTPETVMRGFVDAGSSGAQGLLNSLLVEENCAAAMDQTSCAGASRELELSGSDSQATSGAPRAAGAAPALLALLLGAAAWVA